MSLSYFENFYKSRLGRYACSCLYDVFGIDEHKKTLWLGYAKNYIPNDEKNYWGEGFSKTDQVSEESNKRVFSYHQKTLPFYYQDFEKANIIHALELSDAPDNLLKEIYRVLKPEADITVIVPNRAGLWAWGDHNPFGQGQPYSKKQIRQILENNQFTVLDIEPLLFLPPTQSKLFLRSFKWLDKVGRYLWPQFCGVYVVRAKKRVYGATPIKADIKEFSINPIPA